MPMYKVVATINGKKKTAKRYWKNKRRAQKFARETNQFWYPSAHAKVMIHKRKRKRR